MPRIRTIKPEIAADVKLASVSIAARYTFVLLISQSDDEGLIAGSQRQLLGALYPHDDAVTPADLAAWIGELIAVGLLRWRVTRDGAPVLEITNWSRHQRVDNKGRSQLSSLLVPLADSLDTVAEPRGESPRTAEPRRLEEEVGPRTLDQGPRTGAASSSLEQFTAEHDFGPFVPQIAGLIRVARNPDAVIAQLRLHLSGEMGAEKATPLELGLAAQQYLAGNETAFKAQYFAGFIRTVKKGTERTENRRRNSVEDRRIATEQEHRERADLEDKRTKELIERHARERPKRHAELEAAAERSIPTTLTFGRAALVASQLARLIREDLESAA